MKKYALIALGLIIVLVYALSKNKEQESKQPIEDKLYALAKQSAKDYNASATHIIVVDSSNGDLVASVVASSISPKEHQDLWHYYYEPGNVIAPIFYAYALDKKGASPKDIVNCFGGKYKIGPKTITDYHKFENLSMEDVIVHSSNIGIVQITKEMDPYEFHEILEKFGFKYIPPVENLKHEIFKAVTSYGYGMKASLIELVRAYSVFNNNGVFLIPKSNSSGKSERVISASSAKQVQNTLIEAVQRGTGNLAKHDTIETGGKTGTSHMLENDLYVNKYNSTFVGFANGQKNRYVIGVLIVDPKKGHIASKTAAPTFKKVIDLLVEQNYLK